MSKDLGVVKVSADNEVQIVLPSAQADIDGAYDDSLDRLRTRPRILAKPKVRQCGADRLTRAVGCREGEDATGVLCVATRLIQADDADASVRTNVLGLWCLSNAALVGVILAGDLSATFSAGKSDTRTRIYMVRCEHATGH